MKEGLRYRPDIDGLRALAVAVVIAFHFGVGRLQGGFVGVDVFFVISGYLITSLIRNDLGRDRFTIREFYIRRVRRIFPALFVVLAVVAVAGVMVLFPNDLFELRRTLAAATLFASNIYFYRSTDYFAAPDQEQPLLHTWSLSVEEQFYLVFPVLMLLLHRYLPRRWVAVLATISLGSLALSAWSVSNERTAEAFYLLPMRAWELGAGALLAAAGSRELVRGRAAHVVSCAGLALIGYAAMAYDATTPFPGLRALPPVLGAVLLIAAGERSAVGRVLSWRPVVLVGLMSYSLYLWHYPVLVFYRAYRLQEPSTVVRWALVALSLLLAALSWRFVERPFRRARPTFRRLATVAVATLVVFVGVAYALQPVANRLNPVATETRRLLAFDNRLDRSQMRRGTCFVVKFTTNDERFDADRCLSSPPGRRRMLLVGDSHAAHLWRGLQEALPGVSLEQATVSDCRPVVPFASSQKCVDVLRHVFDEHVPRGGLDAVILSARWRQRDLPGLPAAVARLKQSVRRVVVLGPSPEYTSRLPRLLARGVENGDPGLADSRLTPQHFEFDRILRDRARQGGYEYVSLIDAVCPGGVCQTFAAPGVPMLSDESHFTLVGSRVVAQRIVAAIARGVSGSGGAAGP